MCTYTCTRPQGSGPLGAGDLLLSLLGAIIASFGFRVYAQRDAILRRLPQLLGGAVLGSAFGIFRTAYAAKALGLSSGGYLGQAYFRYASMRQD